MYVFFTILAYCTILIHVKCYIIYVILCMKLCITDTLSPLQFGINKMFLKHAPYHVIA